MSVETQKENSQDVSDAVIVDAVVEEDNSNSQESRTIVQEDNKEEKVVVSEKDNSEDELETYSENVQKRINQLTAKRKQAIEEAQAAYQYAQHMKQENDQLKNGYLGIILIIYLMTYKMYLKNHICQNVGINKHR